MRKCTHCGHEYDKPVRENGWGRCPECGGVGWRAVEGKPVIISDTCICVDLINCNPNPQINPDCPIHGTLDG